MIKHKRIIYYSIFTLFTLLPIIDCLRRTKIKDIELLNISIIEIFNIIVIISTSILTIINQKQEIKKTKLILIYTLILLTYIIFHNINILSFNQAIYLNSNINIITETYYILRVYYMPILLLFVLTNNQDIFNYRFYFKILKTLICLISISIVLLNILKLSYRTYELTNNEFVNYNIFDFYKSSESPKLLSTRGWFDSANEISAILIMLLPLNIYMLYKEQKTSNVLTYVIQFIAMIILGTRISAVGAIITTITIFLISIFTKTIKTSKINLRFITSGMMCVGYFFISPVGTYLLNQKNPNYNTNHSQNLKLNNLKNKQEISKYIQANLYNFRINKVFINIYPIENDIDFWKKIAIGDRNKNNNSRIMKTNIIARIKERNQNPIDTFLGMGYTINFIDLERDYVYQYYIFGILGIILILPQIVSIIKSLKICLINLNTKNLLNKSLLIMSPFLGLITAYLSGHIFGWISPSYIFVLTISILNYYTKTKEVNLCLKYQ